MTQDTKTSVMVFRDLIEKQVSQFLKVMDQRTTDRFVRMLMTNYQENRQLQQCDPMSLVHVAMRAAQDGLMLDGKEAAVVPFKDRDRGTVYATYVPMITGIRKKVRNSGQILDWNVTAVFEGDECVVSLGTNQYVNHKPSLTGGRKRPLIGVYSIANFRGGGQAVRWMGRDEIEEIRGKSKAKSGPWDDPVFYPEMAVKTCARAHSKQLPMSSDMVAFWQRDDDDTGALGSAAPPIQSTSASNARIASVADTLDEFGAAAETPKLSPPVDSAPKLNTAPGSDGGAATPNPTPVESRGPDRPKAASGSAAEIDAVKRAYRRGQDDRRNGKANDAMPQEYQDNARNKEQLAWWSGYDGKPMPTWSQQ